MKTITNRYEIIDKLGQGGMGAVWRVYDRLTQTKVALKQVLIPENQLNFASKANTDDIDKLRLSLAQEFSLLATLRHPHILSVLDFGFDDEGHPFYTMTLLEGGMDFKSYAEDLSHEEKIRVLTQMLQALHYLHRRGILHRDLKPDNVLIDKDGQVKVMDFGLAKKESKDSHQSTKDGNISGTIMYMSPELFQGDKASVSSDLFAFGLMAYEVLVGKYPFEFTGIANLIMQLMTATPDTSMLSPELADWLDQLLSKTPDERPQSAYDALQALYTAQQLEMPAETQLIRESFLQASEFIGRDAELKQLTTALNTIDDASAFFLVGGESGVGKSRLLNELRIEALVRNALVMRGQGVEGGGLPFQLWRDIVRRMLLVVEVADLQVAILKDIVPDIDGLLQREIAQAAELTGKAYQDRMVLTIVDLFRNLPQPVVLLLEDLQWTSESLAVLEQMLKVPEQLPKLMLVATYRDDEAPELPEKLASMTHIKLERLTPDAVSELSSAMLGDVGMNDEVVKLLHSQSEGNLFFLVETVRALAEESGDLQRIGQGELPEDVFTGGMQAITRRRLSKVDTQYSAIQTLAAIIGREIDIQLLNHIYDTTTIEAWLSNAADYNVVSIQDNVWHFAHDKLRETIIADIPNETLPQIHRTAAETIEAVYPEDSGYNEALLNHWQSVDDLDKIYQYLLPVAKHMIEIISKYIIAETHLHNMLERLPEDDARRVALWNWLARSAEKQGNYQTSQQRAEQARELAIMLNNQDELATSLFIMGINANYQGDLTRAINLFEQSLKLSQQLDDTPTIAKSLNALGILAHYHGDYTRATNFYEQSLALRQQLGDKGSIAISFHNMGYTAYAQEDYERATDFYQQSLHLCQEIGSQMTLCHNYMELGTIALKQSDEQAVRLFGQALRIAYSIQATPTILWSIVGFVGTLVQAGEAQRAAHYAGLVQSHPAQHSQVRNALNDIMPSLESALRLDDLQAALERGKSLDLDTVVQELLDEFGTDEA